MQGYDSRTHRAALWQSTVSGAADLQHNMSHSFFQGVLHVDPSVLRKHPWAQEAQLSRSIPDLSAFSLGPEVDGMGYVATLIPCDTQNLKRHRLCSRFNFSTLWGHRESRDYVAPSIPSRSARAMLPATFIYAHSSDAETAGERARVAYSRVREVAQMHGAKNLWCY